MSAKSTVWQTIRSSEGQKAYTGKVRRWASALLWGALLPATLLLVWQVLGDRGLISSLLFPTPSTIWSSFLDLWSSGLLFKNVGITVYRTVVGFLIGSGLGLLLGLLIGLFKGFERLFDSTIQMIRMIPHVSVTFLFVLWFGIGETSKLMLIAKGTFFPLYIYTFLGIRNADNKLFEVTKVLGFTWWKRIVKLVIPATIPNIVLGLRLSVAIAWLSVVVAELMGSTSGLGYLMMDARYMSDTPTVFVGILVFSLLGVLSDLLIKWMERRLLRWRTPVPF